MLLAMLQHSVVRFSPLSGTAARMAARGWTDEAMDFECEDGLKGIGWELDAIYDPLLWL